MGRGGVGWGEGVGGKLTGMYTNRRIDQDGHWQQFGTQPILISAPQWAVGPVMHQLDFTWLAKSRLCK